MNTGGPDNSYRGGAMDRFVTLVSDGGRSGKLDLLLHLLANLSRPILLLGPTGSGKTSLLRQVQSRAQENWVTCYLDASASLNLERVCDHLLQTLRQTTRSSGDLSPESQLEAELAQLSRKNGRLILLLDDAGALLPGLLGAVCQFTRLHPEIKLAFALRPEELPQKSASDPLALADAHLIDISPLTGIGSAPPSRQAPLAQPREMEFAKAFLAAFKPRKRLNPKSLAPMIVALLAAATATGFVVQWLWHADPPSAEMAGTNREVPSGEIASAPPQKVMPEASASPQPSPAAAAAIQPQNAAPPNAPAAIPAPYAVDTPAAPPLAALESTPAPEAKPAETALAQLIAMAPTSRSPAYDRLLGIWGVEPKGASGDECAYAKRKKLRCLPLRTDWKELQNLNRPAVLELIHPDGSRRYVALTGMTGEQAILDVNGKAHREPLTEIQPYWRGDAVILWKPPFDKGSVGPRERNEAVRWIRARLGVPAEFPELETLFDEEVKAKVIAFQRKKGLIADGRAGAPTLLHIQQLADDPDAPKLSAPRNTP